MGKQLENKIQDKDRRVEKRRLMEIYDWDQIYKIDLLLAGAAISGFIAIATCIYLHNHPEVYHSIINYFK